MPKICSCRNGNLPLYKEHFAKNLALEINKKYYATVEINFPSRYISTSKSVKHISKNHRIRNSAHSNTQTPSSTGKVEPKYGGGVTGIESRENENWGDYDEEDRQSSDEIQVKLKR
jgi:hypothetical protein